MPDISHQVAVVGLTCISAGVAESFTYPIDAVKTRLQLQGQQQQQQQTTPNRGALATARQVLRREGIRGLYAGVAPAVVRHFFYSGTRISVYEQLRSQWQPTRGSGEVAGQAQAAAPLSLGAKLLMGLTAGATGQLVAVPADLVKVRLQADSRAVAAGLQPSARYKGMVHALHSIIAQEGIRGLWRGAVPAVQRAALVNLGELATYDMAKEAVHSSGQVPEGLLTHAAASCASGLVATMVSTPADVIKTRVMGQDPARPLYRGSVDCLVKSVRQEGVMALYKGFFPTWLRLGPWQMIFWVSYERLRLMAGLGSF